MIESFSNKHSDALELHARAIQIRNRVLGKFHPQLAARY